MTEREFSMTKGKLTMTKKEVRNERKKEGSR
jgi:hypothetical protein